MSSLKVRLTLLYTIILGFILLLFSIAVYFIAILTLKAQVDESLGRNWNFGCWSLFMDVQTLKL